MHIFSFTIFRVSEGTFAESFSFREKNRTHSILLNKTKTQHTKKPTERNANAVILPVVQMFCTPLPHAAQAKALMRKSAGVWPQTRFPANLRRTPVPTAVTSARTDGQTDRAWCILRQELLDRELRADTSVNPRARVTAAWSPGTQEQVDISAFHQPENAKGRNTNTYSVNDYSLTEKQREFAKFSSEWLANYGNNWRAFQLDEWRKIWIKLTSFSWLLNTSGEATIRRTFHFESSKSLNRAYVSVRAEKG